MLRILFAHPDQKLSQIHIGHLQNHFTVDSVQDGLSAQRKIKILQPSLVVSDYNLPLLSGIALLRFVRSHPRLGAIPFIFLSSHHDNSEALSFGANDWLDIEFCSSEILLNRIFHHLKTNKYGLQISRA